MSKRATRRMVVGALSMSVVWLSGLAHAEDAKVAVQADTVFASTKAGDVPEDLKPMQRELAQGVKYLTLKRLDSKKLTLTPKPTNLQLPNKKAAELSVESLKDDVAVLKVDTHPPKVTYKLGKGKTIYIQAGKHDGGDLWLVLSQPR